MNTAKTLLQYLWNPFMCHFVKKLGFRTPRAQEVVRNSVDHHRSRQILSAAFMALSLELLAPYVRYPRGKSEIPTGSEYFSWVASEVKDGVYLFLFDMCWTFLLAFELYTEAVRKNNHVNMLAVLFALFSMEGTIPNIKKSTFVICVTEFHTPRSCRLYGKHRIIHRKWC